MTRGQSRVGGVEKGDSVLTADGEPQVQADSAHLVLRLDGEMRREEEQLCEEGGNTPGWPCPDGVTRVRSGRDAPWRAAGAQPWLGGSGL